MRVRIEELRAKLADEAAGGAGAAAAELITDL